ncbi:neutral zinc metallopeptidase [soil metagenome]
MFRVATLVVALILAVSGCAQVIEGRARPGEGIRSNVTPADYEIIGGTDSQIDQLSRNALADITTYWEQTFPEVFGAGFEPLAGGVYSVDPGDFDASEYPGDIGCFDDVEDVENNAFYCFPPNDNIVYDRVFIDALAQEYGLFIPALVLSHEYGHTIQGRQPPPSDLSIVYEAQADCYAGAWSAWVVEGNAEHFIIRPSELDDVLRGYLLLRDEPGSGPTDRGAHGSYFDRVSAFQEGFDQGAQACADNYSDERLFTQGEFSQADLESRGNSPYDETLMITADTLNAFWTQALDEVFDVEWTAPALESFDGGVPTCDGARQRRIVTYCEPDNRVDFDGGELMPTVHAEIGDFAVSTLIGVQYALSARAQLGLDFRGENALRSAICLTGWYAGQFFLGSIEAEATISPGDLDESIQVLLEYGTQGDVLPDVGLSGFQQVDLFREGALEGASACDVGV